MSDLKEQSVKALANYLKRRIKQITGRNPSEINGSISLLRKEDWESKIEDQVNKVVDVLVSGCIKAKRNGGPLKLTNTAARIGRAVLDVEDDYPVEVYLRVGDLFIEALFLRGYINIDRPGGPRSKAPIIITLRESIEDLIPGINDIKQIDLLCTIQHKPDPTLEMKRRIGNYSGPAIKRSKDLDVFDYDDDWVKALDKMQQTAWKLNEAVYEAVMCNAFLFITSNSNANESDKSRSMAFNYLMRKARAVIDLPKFYQGMDCDYRGRYYTIESGLDYQSSDECRGMYLFHEGKPLTESGKSWLAVYTASSFNKSYSIDDFQHLKDKDEYPFQVDYISYLREENLDTISLDKMTIDDQIAWTVTNMPHIIDLGNNSEFWMVDEDSDEFAAEKPVAFLACCLEWSNYSNTPHDEEYISHLPIPIDAHSSGWQHLAAATLDEQTGQYVGLIPSDIPVDFYVSVAKGVIKISKELDEDTSKFLSGLTMKIIRKCITKRASMILAYSAGKGTLANTIIVDSEQNGLEVPKEIAKSLAELIVETILRICPGPLRTMKYFQQLAEFELGKFGWFKGSDEEADRRVILRRRCKDYLSNFDNLSQEELDDYNSITALLKEQDVSAGRRKLRAKVKDMFSQEEDFTEEQLLELSALQEQVKEFRCELIAGNGSRFLTWTTPSNFPVKYENYVSFQKTIPSYIEGYGKTGYVGHVVRIPGDNPSRSEFVSGVSPNIIHSMDATQLALTCIRHEGAFAGVHDSYATHASDVEDLLQTSKEVFIELYEDGKFLERITEDLLSDSTGFGGTRPDNGVLDMDLIYESDGFFS